MGVILNIFLFNNCQYHTLIHFTGIRPCFLVQRDNTLLFQYCLDDKNMRNWTTCSMLTNKNGVYYPSEIIIIIRKEIFDLSRNNNKEQENMSKNSNT